MELIILIIIGVLFLMVFGALFFIYGILRSHDILFAELTDLITRTFQQYYKTENIQPVMVNNGIDLIWNPDNEDVNKKRGFITIWTQDDNEDSPIINMKDADILGGKIIDVVEKHIQDRDIGG